MCGVKEDLAQCTQPKFLGKAGWVKKAPGKLLASYKDRYIHVEKTEIVVYENEDLQNCLERIDLESYDKCHELKSPFKKKHRLILIRSAKSGNKVNDVKLQAQTAEEKEAWIKALSDGISRAKNKVFDEVKVDESSNLEHVTRTRPKATRNRRPPTRIHMKEVADVSSDGILRLDLDLEDAVMPNGTHHANVDGSETPKEAIKATEKNLGTNAEWEVQTGPEVSPQKKVKPPMPPTKETKPSLESEEELDKPDGLEKKVLKPPMPPCKEAKPCISPAEESTGEAKADMSEKCPDTRKKADPPPTPPNKPSSSSPIINLAETNSHPPATPSKEKKPSTTAMDPTQEDEGTGDENKEKEEDSGEQTKGTAVETDEADQMISKEALSSVSGDKNHCAKGQDSEEESRETIRSGINKASDKEPQILVQPDMQHMRDMTQDNPTISQPDKGEDPAASLQTASDTSASSFQVEELLPSCEVPSVGASLNDPLSDSLSLSPLLCHLHGEKEKKAEEKSVDSGQQSDDDSEGSGSEHTVATSTAEDNIQNSVSLRQKQAETKHQVNPKGFPFQRSVPAVPAKPHIKAKSASIGDLLSDSPAYIQVRQNPRSVSVSDRSPVDNVMKLETEVALEMEKTSDLLSRLSQSHTGGDREGMPEDLLVRAMEKLKKADRVLREVKKLTMTKTSSNRKSW
uniref:pleckstrin homology domain-containing family O member 2 isoform X2 n=1 Tax=Monopterus albus TaxID=43700 RepID=UPI0009B457E1|nr:pleckstrin homology domain-containing family O member 2 isoform X2 [Monopterus albus]